MKRAASHRDRGAVAKAQQELNRLAAREPEPAKGSRPADPFERMLDDFRFKQAPLYVQQVTSSRRDHRIFVGVDRATFCLLNPQARRRAAAQVYARTDRRLRAAGVADFEFLVVALTQTAPTYDMALAIGEHGRLRLTPRGRGC